MVWMRVSRLVVTGLVGGALVGAAGCGASVAAPAAPAATSTTAAPTTAPTPPPGTVALTGDVKTPTQLVAAQLAGLPQQTVKVAYGSSKGAEQHTETGVPLAGLLPVSALATTPRKNDQLDFAVVATGADGYSAAVSYGEISPDFGNRGVLVALSEDGKPLDRPRLVVPGDVKGGRYVSGLTELRVVRLG